MTLSEFKQRVRSTFGPRMEHATPANVREFLDAVATERWQEEKNERSTRPNGQEPEPLDLSGPQPNSYEEILRHFFAEALSAPNESALIQLWLLSLDLAYSGLEEQAGHDIGTLFTE